MLVPDTRAHIVNFDPLNGGILSNAASPVTITFDKPIDSTDVDTYIRVVDTTDSAYIDPSLITVVYNTQEYQLGISGPWSPSHDYTVVVSKDLPSAFGNPLGNTYNYRFQTAAYTTLGSIQLMSPADGSRESDIPTFIWTAPTNATLHEIQLSQGSWFSDVYVSSTIGTLATAGMTLSYTPSTLEASKVYYWRVRGFGGGWSEVWDFYYGEVPATAPSTPFQISYVEPADQTVHSILTAVTIHFSSTPVLPSSSAGTTGAYDYAGAAYWRAESAVNTSGSQVPWWGEWSVSGDSLVWTPSSPTMASLVQYTLYADHLVDSFSRPLSWIPGTPVFSVTGPFTPMYGNHRRVGVPVPEAEAAFYVYEGSLEVDRIMEVYFGTYDISSLITDTMNYAMQRYSVVYARKELLLQRLQNTFDPGSIRDVKLADYSYQYNAQMVDEWWKMIGKLEDELSKLEAQIMGTTDAFVGVRSEGWDPVTMLYDRSYYGAGLAREFPIESDATWRGWRAYPDSLRSRLL